MSQPSERTVPKWHLHRRLYDWVLHWADTPYATPALFLLSFAESSFFPIPPDVLLGPLALGNRRKWFKFALVCSLASVLGGILGYGIGHFVWAGVGPWFHEYVPGFERDTVQLVTGQELEGLLDSDRVKVRPPMMHAEVTYPVDISVPGATVQTLRADQVSEIHVHPFTKAGGLYQTYRFWIVFIAGFTPLPYKIITITAGVFDINFAIFMIASTVSRTARFMLVAGIFGVVGERAKPFIDKYFNLLCVAFIVLLVGGFLVIKYI